MSKKMILAAVFCLLPIVSFAQFSTKDADIDLKMNATDLTGIAPPTGSQSSASVLNVAGAPKFDPYALAAIQSGKVIQGQTDGKAHVYEVRGSATLIKRGNPIEQKVKKGALLEVGDLIITETGASVSIAFDQAYANAVHVTENSKATLESIEPTNIRLENGALFSSVNGLPQGSSWKVTTPSAVAAVRGTLYIVRYLALSGQFYAATVNVPNDGKNSAIDIQPIIGSGGANIPEGKEITLEQGQKPSDALVEDLDPETLAEILSFFESLSNQQQEGGFAPPTGSQGFEGGGFENTGDGANPDQDPGDSVEPDSSAPTIVEPTVNPPVIEPPRDEPDDHHGGHHNDHHHGDDHWDGNDRGNNHGNNDHSGDHSNHHDDHWNDHENRGGRGDDHHLNRDQDRGRDDDREDDNRRNDDHRRNDNEDRGGRGESNNG